MLEVATLKSSRLDLEYTINCIPTLEEVHSLFRLIKGQVLVCVLRCRGKGGLRVPATLANPFLSLEKSILGAQEGVMEESARRSSSSSRASEGATRLLGDEPQLIGTTETKKMVPYPAGAGDRVVFA